MIFFKGYLTLDLDSAESFRGIGIFCPFFALKDFLSNRPLIKVWADRPTAMRFRVETYKNINFTIIVCITVYALQSIIALNQNSWKEKNFWRLKFFH